MKDVPSVSKTALPYVAALTAYQPGQSINEIARISGSTPESIIKLASNENPYGPSPKATAVISDQKDEVHRYPDTFDFTRELSIFLNVSEPSLVLGNGSNDVLDLIARVFLGPGRTAISSEYSFLVYALSTQLTGATNRVVKAKHYGHDLQAMEQAVTRDTRIIWIANPNNPTGTYIPYAELEDFITRLPKEIIIVLDEAYYEYVEDPNKSNSIHWPERYENVIVTRTFSKIYGLAGLRIGYAVCHPIVAELLNRARQPFNVNNIALQAAAEALKDGQYVTECAKNNIMELTTLTKACDDMSVPYIASFANFLTVEFIDAPAVHKKLLERGIIVRPLANYNLPNHLRITVGTEQENKTVIRALEEITEST